MVAPLNTLKCAADADDRAACEATRRDNLEAARADFGTAIDASIGNDLRTATTDRGVNGDARGNAIVAGHEDRAAAVHEVASLGDTRDDVRAAGKRFHRQPLPCSQTLSRLFVRPAKTKNPHPRTAALARS